MPKYHHHNTVRRQPRKKQTEWVHFVQPAPPTDIKTMRRSPRAAKPMREWWDLKVKPSINPEHECNRPEPPPCEIKTLAEKEEWSDQNRYGVKVSTFGRVQLPGGGCTYGSAVSKKRGHLRVEIKHPVNRSRRIKVYVHRLVRETFEDPRVVRRAIGNGWVVNHINNDPADNHLSNLEWVTTQGNADHYHQEIQPGLKRKEALEWVLNGQATRPIWIVDANGAVRQTHRRLNPWNENDRDWMKREGMWDALEERIE